MGLREVADPAPLVSREALQMFRLRPDARTVMRQPSLNTSATSTRRRWPGPWGCTIQLPKQRIWCFPPEHTAYSKPIPGQSSWSQGPLDTLAPNPTSDSHPYPVELVLPRWTVQDDWDLRTWLFRWGAGVRIEQPLALREHHLQQAQGVVDLYGTQSTS
jgi:hypothetical protein